MVRPRSGRRPDVPEHRLSRIRRELSENPSGWKAKEIMNIRHSSHYYGTFSIRGTLKVNVAPFPFVLFSAQILPP